MLGLVCTSQHLLLPLLLLQLSRGVCHHPAAVEGSGNPRCAANQRMGCRDGLQQPVGLKQRWQRITVSWGRNGLLHILCLRLPRWALPAALQQLVALLHKLLLLTLLPPQRLMFSCNGMRLHVLSSCPQAPKRCLAVVHDPPLACRSVAGGAAQRTQRASRGGAAAAAAQRGIQPLPSLQQSFLLVILEEAHRLHAGAAAGAHDALSAPLLQPLIPVRGGRGGAVCKGKTSTMQYQQLRLRAAADPAAVMKVQAAPHMGC